jgi:hypothetical protein
VDVADCEPGPATGNAVVTCDNVTMDMMPDCYLDCSMGETCADGMECFGGFVCVWPEVLPPPVGYEPCLEPGTGCAAGEVCLDDAMGMADPSWEVCTIDGCVDAADCLSAPATGDAPVTCADPTGMGGTNTCYLDCAAGQTCPDGMACFDGSLCAWPQGAVLFEDDFESGDLTAGWTLIDADGLTPNVAVAFVDAAWVVADIDGGNLSAVSTSWYTPAGVSDDWLITPQIMVGPNSRLYWISRSSNGGFPDSLEVRISTAGATVPEFTANMPLLVADPESDEYALHYVDLAPAGYMNQQVYIAFRGTGDDGELLLVDNVSVVELP